MRQYNDIVDIHILLEAVNKAELAACAYLAMIGCEVLYISRPRVHTAHSSPYSHSHEHQANPSLSSTSHCSEYVVVLDENALRQTLLRRTCTYLATPNLSTFSAWSNFVMAEALAGLSIAANVMQVIAFSRDTIIAIKRLSEDKSPAPETKANIGSLEKLIDDLRGGLTAAHLQSQQEKQLAQVADRILKYTDKLNKILQNYQSLQGASKIKRLAKGLKYNFYDEGKLQDLETGLDKLQDLMQSHILVDLKQQIKAGNITASAEFNKLNQSAQEFTRQLEAGILDLKALIGQESQAIQNKVVTEIEATRSSNTEEADKTRQHVSSELQTQWQQMTDVRSGDIISSRHQQLLQSLHFPEMNARASKLNSDLAHEGTFDWIYGGLSGENKECSDQYSTDENERDDDQYAKDEDRGSGDFYHLLDDSNDSKLVDITRNGWTQWLQNDQPIYWISGKPGSGKSTFMHFLINNIKTLELLKANGDGAYIVAAFIWAAGSLMQRSLQGLLCALLHALLVDAPSLIESIGIHHYMYSKRTPNDWSTHELERIFCDVVQKRAKPACIFIDGLDEIDDGLSDGQMKLLELIKRLSTIGGVKLCVSSRPEPILSFQLSGYAHLKLQNVTQRDILRLVTDRLSTPTLNQWIQHQLVKYESVHESYIRDRNQWTSHRPSLQTLAHAVTNRAEGIFLWVSLVTQAIFRGVIKRNDWTTLLKQIDHLPVELSELYEDLWRREPNDVALYRTSTAVFLNTILNPGVTAYADLELLFITDSGLRRNLLAGGSFVSSVEIYRRMQELQQQVVARCCGLVDVSVRARDRSQDNQHAMPEHEAFDILIRRQHDRLSFIHRSARDFLRDTAKGQAICSHDRRTWVQKKSEQFLAGLVSQILLNKFEHNHISTLHDLFIGLKESTLEDSIKSNVRDLALDLRQALFRQSPRKQYEADQLFDFAALLQYWDVVAHHISRLPFAPSPEAVMICSRLLAYCLNSLLRSRAPLKIGLGIIENLLNRGADPNTVITHCRGDRSNLPLLALSLRLYIYKVVMQDDEPDSRRKKHVFHTILENLLQHGLDPGLRFLGAQGPARNVLTFATHPARALTTTKAVKSLPDDIVILVDIGYPHYLEQYSCYVEGLGNWNDEDLDTEIASLLKRLYDVSTVHAPKAVMLIRVTFSEKKIGGLDYTVSRVHGLSSKAVTTALHSDKIMEILDQWNNQLEKGTSAPESPSMSCFGSQESLSIFRSTPGEVMDEKGTVHWLFEHGYLPRSAVDVEDALDILVHSSYYPYRPLDRSMNDTAYRPEYDMFVDAIDKLARKEHSNK